MMLRRVYQIVLFLLLAMVVLTPFMQINSMDQFPLAGDDFEIWVISILSGIGILLLLGRLLSLVPGLWHSRLPLPPPCLRSLSSEVPQLETASFQLIVPLRI